MLPTKPRTAAEVLAVVLCPARAFAAGAGADEAAAAVEVMRPVKAELIRRFCRARARRARN